MDWLQSIIDNPRLLLKHSLDAFDLFTNTVDSYCKDLAPWQIILYTLSVCLIFAYFYSWYYEIPTDLVTYFKMCVLDVVKKLPFLNSKIAEELEGARKSLENDIAKSNKGLDYVRKLPDKGLTIDQVHDKINSYLKMAEAKWMDGACSGCVYGADDNLAELTADVYKKFCWSNVMHADVFPDARKMEAEVVRMVLTMFNGDDDTCGTMTSGGTESIMLACKAHRELAYKRGIKKPEIVMPVTAHVAFDKAGMYFNMRVHHVPVDPVTKRVNPKQMEKYINSNTCMIVGSAVNFPYGCLDPIEDIAKLGLKYKIPVHVDACLGGFLGPFMEEAGYKLPYRFDFRVPGVISISCDTHKYGYTPKGSSVIMYRNRDYRQNQFFSYTDWPGGIYASPTIAGSRQGCTIAMTWATMMHIGHQGYVESTRQIIETTRYIENELRKIKEIKVSGCVDLSIVAFESDQFNIFRVLDEMSHYWHLNALQNPPAIHIAVTKMQTKEGVAKKFVDDLKKAVDHIMKQPDRKLGKIAQIYCSSQNIPDRRLISDVSYLFLDACYSTSLKAAAVVANGTNHH